MRRALATCATDEIREYIDYLSILSWRHGARAEWQKKGRGLTDSTTTRIAYDFNNRIRFDGKNSRVTLASVCVVCVCVHEYAKRYTQRVLKIWQKWKSKTKIKRQK